MFNAIIALCLSVAVISMNTFLVSRDIFEKSELIKGGNESTLS